MDSDSDMSINEVNLGINGPFTKTKVGAVSHDQPHGNASDEEILGSGYREASERVSHGPVPKKGQITVTETVSVDRS